ncbi:unnamed protein product [Heterobilharzia americana]|nr:unnamed protein product [Heterobilharzia americana]
MLTLYGSKCQPLNTASERHEDPREYNPVHTKSLPAVFEQPHVWSQFHVLKTVIDVFWSISQNRTGSQ